MGDCAIRLPAFLPLDTSLRSLLHPAPNVIFNTQMNDVYENLDLQSYAEGSYIVTQGEVGDMFYIIKDGQVRGVG